MEILPPGKLPKGAQLAALCFRMRKNGKHQVLLITSRGSGRWIPPKGWPIRGQSHRKTAAQEAFEEAGVKGSPYSQCLGLYKYVGRRNGSEAKEAYLYPLKVTGFARKFPEKGQRIIKWFSPKKAAMLVREPKLKKLLLRFDPSDLIEQ